MSLKSPSFPESLEIIPPPRRRPKLRGARRVCVFASPPASRFLRPHPEFFPLTVSRTRAPAGAGVSLASEPPEPPGSSEAKTRVEAAGRAQGEGGGAGGKPRPAGPTHSPPDTAPGPGSSSAHSGRSVREGPGRDPGEPGLQPRVHVPPPGPATARAAQRPPGPSGAGTAGLPGGAAAGRLLLPPALAWSRGTQVSTLAPGDRVGLRRGLRKIGAAQLVLQLPPVLREASGDYRRSQEGGSASPGAPESPSGRSGPAHGGLPRGPHHVCCPLSAQ